MTQRTRYFMFGSMTVLLVGLCTGLVAYYTGMPMGAFGGTTGPSELQYVPAAAAVVAYADVQQVMHSEFRQKVRAAMDKGENGQREFQNQTGIDIEKDIDHVVAYSEPGSEKQYTGMVLAAGRFDAGRLETLARTHGGVAEDYKGKRLVSMIGEVNRDEQSAEEGHAGRADHPGHGDHPLAIAFLGPGLVAVGGVAAIRQAIDRQGRQSVLDNSEMMALVKDLDSSNAWAVGRFDALMSQAALPQNVASQIPAVKWFSASANINGGVRGTVRAEARDEQAGQNLRDVVNGFLALARMQAGSKPEMQSLVNSLQLSGTGKTVTLNFQIPTEVIDLLGGAASSHSHKRAED
jgi:hypothetical protein